MSSIILSHNFEPASVTFGSVEKTKKGGKVVYIGTGPDGKGRLSIQTPTLFMPFGVTPYQDNPGGDIQSYSVDMSFRGDDPKVKEFQRKIEELDEVLIQTATDNSEAWFGKKMTRELVTEFYRKLLNNKNPAYPPVIRTKVGVGFNGEISARFYDEQRNPVPIEYLTKGTAIKTICEISSVWFVNKTFGATLRLVQAAVVTKPNKLQEYAFQDDTDMAENADAQNAENAAKFI